MRVVNALFVAVFGIMICIAGFNYYGFGAIVLVVLGLLSIGYGGYIAFSRGTYFMTDWFYALPIVGGLILFAGLDH
ncbi:hypothetical protein AB0H49_05565 [Nocardia sp. NPDC050713]|uniref:hypothetical protein n=1 Tax=unclassified Nocardia TaxID=2637762 RepID=UPI0033AE5C1F